jgi:hypothetical protein
LHFEPSILNGKRKEIDPPTENLLIDSSVKMKKASANYDEPQNAGTGNDEMGADRNMRGACRPTVSAAGGLTAHSSGALRRLTVFLISSSIEFC